MIVRVVEDDPFIASMLESALPRFGLRTEVTSDHFEDLLGLLPWVGIEVAVVDYMLGPDAPFNGDVVLEWLKEHLPHIRRILFSAVGGIGIVNEEHLADVVLPKPSDIETIVEAIRGR